MYAHFTPLHPTKPVTHFFLVVYLVYFKIFLTIFSQRIYRSEKENIPLKVSELHRVTLFEFLFYYCKELILRFAFEFWILYPPPAIMLSLLKYNECKYFDVMQTMTNFIVL